MLDRISKAHSAHSFGPERWVASLQKKLSRLQARVDELGERIADQSAIKEKLHTMEKKFQWLQKTGASKTDDAVYMLRREVKDFDALLSEIFSNRK